MISVQNLRPLLNGNKLIALFCACVLISCNAFKVISSDRPVQPVAKEDNPEQKDEATDNDNEPVTDSKPETKNIKENKVHTVEFFGQEFQVEPHKTEFRVALILPFYTTSTDPREKRTADIMLQYYQGVKMALKEMEIDGLKMKLFVFDNENDKVKLEKILDKTIMKHMDVIVGPITKEHMEIVSDFGKGHDIAVISPFTSLEDFEKDNSLLYSPTPGYSAKADRMVDYIQKHYAKDKVIIYGDNKSFSKKMTSLLTEKFDKSGNTRVSVFNSGDRVNWNTNLEKGKNTVVCVLSHNSTFVNTTLATIYQSRKDVVVFGENNWSDFEDNDYNFWNDLNVHLVASDFVNDTMSSVRSFRTNFRLVNKVDPGIYAYLGYDQFKFMGEFLMAFGEHFPGYINDREFRYLSSNFNYHLEGGVNQNKNVFILKFDDFMLKPVE